MRRNLVYPLFILAALGAASTNVRAQTGEVAVTNLEGQARFSTDQIDNLTGPVALYPDALLAQVLVAATFPDQVSDAAAFVRANGTANIDTQQWDISVKAVAHYPSALNAMADKADWTTALGQAYASQSSEVMQSVQRLRTMASQNGNLNSTPQQQVIQQGTTYEIVPVQPRVIYVPVYDPYVVYSRPIFSAAYSSRFWSFGVGFPIGSWLSYDCDWGTQRVYYNGWAPEYYGYSGNWRLRSQPYVRITDIYVSPRYRTVYVNRTVINHTVDYRNVDRYASVHGGTHFENRYDNRGGALRNAEVRGGEVRGVDVRRDGGYNGGNNRGDVRNDRANDRGQATAGGYRGGRDANGNRVNSGNGANTGATTGTNNGVNNGTTDGNRGANGNLRMTVPERRHEPGQRMDGQRPQLMAPTRGGAPASGTVQQTQPQAQPQPQQQQSQAQPQRQAVPRQTRVEQQRTPPAKQSEQHAKPPERHEDRGRGEEGRHGH